MKKLIDVSIAFVAILALFAAAAAQVRKSAAPGSRAVQGEWQPVKIDKLGIREVMLPPGMKLVETTDTKAKPEDKIPTDALGMKWSIGVGRSAKEVNVSITNWHADFATVTERPADLVTPENLVLITHLQGLQAIKDKTSHTIESELLEVDGVPGSYDVLNSPIDGLVVVWGTDRYLNGNAQQIMISVSRFAKADALRVIRSIKFSPSDLVRKTGN